MLAGLESVEDEREPGDGGRNEVVRRWVDFDSREVGAAGWEEVDASDRKAKAVAVGDKGGEGDATRLSAGQNRFTGGGGGGRTRRECVGSGCAGVSEDVHAGEGEDGEERLVAAGVGILGRSERGSGEAARGGWADP